MLVDDRASLRAPSPKRRDAARVLTPAQQRLEASITVVDKTADAALVKVDLFRDEKQIFTDYLSLYRFKDGWKMVAKTFQRLKQFRVGRRRLVAIPVSSQRFRLWRSRRRSGAHASRNAG